MTTGTTTHLFEITFSSRPSDEDRACFLAAACAILPGPWQYEEDESARLSCRIDGLFPLDEWAAAVIVSALVSIFESELRGSDRCFVAYDFELPYARRGGMVIEEVACGPGAVSSNSST